MIFYLQIHKVHICRSMNTRVCRFPDLLELRHHAVRATLAPGIPLQGGLEAPHVPLVLSLQSVERKSGHPSNGSLQLPGRSKVSFLVKYIHTCGKN